MNMRFDKLKELHKGRSPKLLERALNATALSCSQLLEHYVYQYLNFPLYPARQSVCPIYGLV